MKRTAETGSSSIDSLIESLGKYVFPHVVYSADLFNQPYKVNFDHDKCAKFFKFMGLSDNNFRKTTIILERGPVIDPATPPNSLEVANYDLDSTTISIAIDWVWQIYQYNLTLAKEIIETKKPPEPEETRYKSFLKPCWSGLKTKRLPSYLSSLPQEQTERGLKFTCKLLSNASNRHLNHSLLHEAKHAVDCQSIFSALFYRITDFISRHNLQFYQFDPQEKRARTETSRLIQDPRWRSIITIQPKSPT